MVGSIEICTTDQFLTSGAQRYAYAPLPDFKGRDHFVVRACAIVGERKGCSTLIYDVTVR
jgi:hypothetical protein